MNLNELAKRISQLEGKKKSLNIAQIKEVIKSLGIVFQEIGFWNFVKLSLLIKKNGHKK